MDALFGGPVAANDSRKACKQCGAMFAPKPRQIFCCEACRRLSDKLSRNLQAENEKRHANAPERFCEACGSSFRRKPSSKDAARFCSRACGYAARSNVSPRKDGVDRFLAKEAALFKVSHKVALCKCQVCGSRFRSSSLASLYCSQDCRLAKYVADNDNVDRAPRPCVECGGIFSPEYGSKRRTFCSVECARRNARRVRRKKEKARLRVVFVESVDPIKVFERDKWKCQECGRKTPRSLRGTYDDRAPELDHIMPLALGGAHSYLNTQCLCRKCNAAKSDSPPEQASLFAYG